MKDWRRLKQNVILPSFKTFALFETHVIFVKVYFEPNICISIEINYSKVRNLNPLPLFLNLRTVRQERLRSGRNPDLGRFDEKVMDLYMKQRRTYSRRKFVWEILNVIDGLDPVTSHIILPPPTPTLLCNSSTVPFLISS